MHQYLFNFKSMNGGVQKNASSNTKILFTALLPESCKAQQEMEKDLEKRDGQHGSWNALHIMAKLECGEGQAAWRST
jgi:hypothetical protein